MNFGFVFWTSCIKIIFFTKKACVFYLNMLQYSQGKGASSKPCGSKPHPLFTGIFAMKGMNTNMTVNITAKKIQISQAFTDYVMKKIESKLDRFFTGDADCKVTLTEQKNMITAEVTVRTAGLIFRSEQKAADKNDAFDACIDRIIRQIRKNKTRVEKQMHSTFVEAFDDSVEEQVDFEVVKHKKFKLRPMSTDEAILQMNMLGHTFFMFKNAETGAVNVVYKRDDDNYAVLEPDEN